jgi:hypothetical protein
MGRRYDFDLGYVLMMGMGYVLEVDGARFGKVPGY